MKKKRVNVTEVKRITRIWNNMDTVFAHGVSENEIRFRYPMSNGQLARSIRNTIKSLNFQIKEAERRGITIELKDNHAGMSSDLPHIQAEIYERRKL